MKNYMIAVLALPALVAPAAETDSVVFEPEAGSSVTKTLELTLDFELSDISGTIIVNGEEHPSPPFDQEMRQLHERRVVIEDEYVEVKDGRPLKLRRTFEEISVERTQEMTTQDDEHSNTREGESPLAGSTVVFTWDPEEEEYVVAYAEDNEEEDEDLLEYLEIDTDFRGLLPEEPPEPEDEWEMDARELYLQMLYFGGILQVQYEGEEDKEEEDEPGGAFRKMAEDMEGEIKATFLEIQEEDDLRLAVIELEGEITGQAQQEREIEMETGEHTETAELTLELELKGKLLWNLDQGRLHDFKIEGDATLNIETVTTSETDQMTFERTILQELTGTIAGGISTE